MYNMVCERTNKAGNLTQIYHVNGWKYICKTLNFCPKQTKSFCKNVYEKQSGLAGKSN